MGEGRSFFKTLTGKPIGKRLLGTLCVHKKAILDMILKEINVNL